MVRYRGNYYFTVKEIAVMLELHETGIRKYCREGKLKAAKHYIKSIDRAAWCVSEDDFVAFYEEWSRAKRAERAEKRVKEIKRGKK